MSARSNTAAQAEKMRAAELSYKEQKALARDADPAVRRDLAEQADIQPEILYYLAEDDAPEVRRAIAKNDSTPNQADLILARDRDEQARCLLARKISRLAPDLNPAQKTRVEELTLEVLDILARDQLPRVRQIVAEEIKDCGNVPANLVKLLARDDDFVVCSPILEFSPLLTDDDLIEIIESSPVQGALSSISRRDSVASNVCDAIVTADDEAAVAALLANSSAQIREETLDDIIDRAPTRVSWQEPLVERPNLSHRAVKRIAQFVTASLLATLEKHHGLDTQTSQRVAKAVNKRLSPSGLNKDGLPKARAERLFNEGKLDDQILTEAIMKNDREFVLFALALKSGLGIDVVSRVMDSRRPKAVVALAWKAGLAMRTALHLQMRTAKIPHTDMLNARDGTDYPMSNGDLQAQLSLFTDFVGSFGKN